ncbi:putative ribonuclease H domain, reverse transcriptase zinc-binding domain-containing protein [Arabidopsis thaliana]
MHCLSQYGHISGQMINVEKSSVTFGNKVEDEIRNWIKQRSGIQVEGGMDKYLGLPECFSGSKQKLLGKIHWIGAQKLILPKALGGFGFKDLQCFNQALLAKQAWRLYHDTDSLLSQVLKCKYYLNSDFLSATKGTRPSYSWQSILFGRDLLVKGLKKIIGNGEKTMVWIDNWLFEGHPRRPESIPVMVDITLKVSHLLDPASKNWNLNMLRDLFPWKDIQLILAQRPMFSREDSFCWAGTNHGLYIVKSGYELSSRLLHKEMFREAQEQPSVNPIFQGIWNLYTAPKIKVFLWKAVKGAVSVEDRLRTRGILIDDGCYMCHEANETINHILFQCPLARQVWALSLLQSPSNGFGSSIFTNMNHILHNCKNLSISGSLRSVSPWIIWMLWKNRNKLLFEDADKKWIPPPMHELKCNIGAAWSRKNLWAGVSWVVRDNKGLVLFHSRRSFYQVLSFFDAKVKSWEYALESMNQLHLDRVTFGASSHDIIKALNNPNAWPALKGHVEALLSLIKGKPFWFMALETRQGNTCANEIAKSVITGMRWQSYVAQGYPQWLRNLFESEMIQ